MRNDKKCGRTISEAKKNFRVTLKLFLTISSQSTKAIKALQNMELTTLFWSFSNFTIFSHEIASNLILNTFFIANCDWHKTFRNNQVPSDRLRSLNCMFFFCKFEANLMYEYICWELFVLSLRVLSEGSKFNGEMEKYLSKWKTSL